MAHTPPQHGTRSMYVKGCHCRPCRAANSRYQTARVRRIAHVAAGAALPARIPVEQARSVVEQLLGVGWTSRRIAVAARISRSNLLRLQGGTSHPRRYILVATYDRLVALLDREPDLSGHQLVDAYSTWQRIHGLIALGYTKKWIARQLGQTAGNGLQLNPYRIQARHADAIRALIDRYGMTPGPNDRARAYAASRGWTADLIWAADDDLDDLVVDPVDDLDVVAIERACAGERVTLTAPERLEVVRRLHAEGLPPTAIAERLHTGAVTVYALLVQLDDQPTTTLEATA